MSDKKLPPASLMFLMQQLATQALMELGEVRNPVTGSQEPSAERAKFTIDLLHILRAKTEKHMDDGERRFIEGALYELSMKYVALSKTVS